MEINAYLVVHKSGKPVRDSSRPYGLTVHDVACELLPDGLKYIPVTITYDGEGRDDAQE